MIPSFRLWQIVGGRRGEGGHRLATLVACCLTFGITATLVNPSAAAARGPQLDRTIQVIPVSGRVFVTIGQVRRLMLRSARLVPVGAVLDSRSGTVRIVSAVNGAGETQSAEFGGGEFEASQPVGDDGTLQVQLVGGNFAACHRASSAAASPQGPVRQLSTIGGYNSGVRSVGRYGSGQTRRRKARRAVVAVAGVVAWDTIDRCDGTSIVDRFGDVETAGQAVPVSFGLTPDESIAYRCGVVPSVSKAYCAVVRGTVTRERLGSADVMAPADHLTLVTNSPSATKYSLDISQPDSFTSDSTYPLTPPDRRGFRRSDVSCVPDGGRGIYQITWRIGTTILASIEYRAAVKSPVQTPCTSVPFGRATPADLTQTLTSAQGHFLVHYTTDPADTQNVSTHAAAETVATTAESALAYYTTTLGMPSYLNDGDGKLDLYIEQQSSPADTTFLTPRAGASTLPPFGEPTAVYIIVPSSQVNDRFALAFALFGALRNAIGRVAGLEPTAFSYSTNAWAANNFTQQDVYVPALSQSLDCDSTCPENAAYAQWRFYQHLAEQFGDPIVAAVVRQDAMDIRRQPGSHMDEALQQVLAAHGTSLAAELSQYALEDVSNGWQAPWVGQSGLAYQADGLQVSEDPTGGTFSDIPPFTVNHLAIRQLVMTVPSLAPCVTDVLTVDVSAPSGGAVPGASVLTQQQYEVIPANPPSGTTQQVAIPFDSCSGAIVRVPFVNGTTSTNSMLFTVSGSLARGG